MKNDIIAKYIRPVLLIMATITVLAPLAHGAVNEPFKSMQYSIQSPVVDIGPFDAGDTTKSESANPDFETNYEKFGFFTTTEVSLSGNPSNILLYLSKNLFSFQEMKPNSIKTDSIVVTLSSSSGSSHQLTVQAEGSLKSNDGKNFIPETRCDGFLFPCTLDHSAQWNGRSESGWGYRTTTLWQPFPNILKQQNPIWLISPQYGSKFRALELTVKVVFPQNIPNQTYQTILELFATPTF